MCGTDWHGSLDTATWYSLSEVYRSVDANIRIHDITATRMIFMLKDAILTYLWLCICTVEYVHCQSCSGGSSPVRQSSHQKTREKFREQPQLPPPLFFLLSINYLYPAYCQVFSSLLSSSILINHSHAFHSRRSCSRSRSRQGYVFSSFSTLCAEG